MRWALTLAGCLAAGLYTGRVAYRAVALLHGAWAEMQAELAEAANYGTPPPLAPIRPQGPPWGPGRPSRARG